MKIGLCAEHGKPVVGSEITRSRGIALALGL